MRLTRINESEIHELKCNKLRIHYFFTENYNIENFAKDTIVEVRLTDGEEWTNIIAQGKIKGITRGPNCKFHNS